MTENDQLIVSTNLNKFCYQQANLIWQCKIQTCVGKQKCHHALNVSNNKGCFVSHITHI